MTALILLGSLVKRLEDYDQHNLQKSFLIDVIVNKNIQVTHILLTFVFGLIQFSSVRYIMREKKILRMRNNKK